MKKDSIELGQFTATGKPCVLDMGTMQGLLITAASGGGKSYVVRRLMEQAFGHIQIICIDPEGEFASLREQFDFIYAGKGGDTPADVRSASLLATRLMELRASAVCDIYELKPEQRHAWVRDFVGALVNMRKELWHPVLLILDEAQMFCPEKGEGESLAMPAVVDMATRGRKRGFKQVFATQRLAQLRKGALPIINNYLVGPTFFEDDAKRAAFSLGIGEKKDVTAFMKERRMAEPGMFYAFGRALALERALLRVGEVATTHPKSGSSKHAAAPPPPSDKVRELLPQLADLPGEAEQKAKTEAELKREISTLKRDLEAAKREAGKVPAPAAADPKLLRESAKSIATLKTALGDAMKIIAQVVMKGFDAPEIDQQQVQNALEAARKSIVELSKTAMGKREREMQSLKRSAEALLARAEKLMGEDVHLEVEVRRNDPISVTPKPEPRAKPNGHAPALDSDRSLSGGALKVVAALLTYPTGLNRNRLRAYCGFAERTLTNYVSELRVAGALVEAGGLLRLAMNAADHYAGALGALPEIPQSTTEVMELWSRRLSGGANKLLKLLVDESGNLVTRERAQEACGFAERTLTNYVSELAVAGLLVRQPGGIAANREELML